MSRKSGGQIAFQTQSSAIDFTVTITLHIAVTCLYWLKANLLGERNNTLHLYAVGVFAKRTSRPEGHWIDVFLHPPSEGGDA